MKFSVALLVLCVVLPNAHGLFGIDWQKVLNETSEKVNSYTEQGMGMAKDLWNKDLESHRTAITQKVAEITAMGKEQIDKNLDVKDLQNKIQAHVDRLRETVANATKTGFAVYEDSKGKIKESLDVEKLKKRLEQLTKPVADFKKWTEETWNEHKDKGVEDWKNLFEQHLNTLSDKATNMTVLARNYADKAEKLWDEHKNLTPAEVKMKMQEQWKSLNNQFAKMTKMGKEMIADVKARAKPLIDRQKLQAYKAKQILRGIKLATNKTMKFAKRHYELAKKMFDETKPAENKMVKDLFESGQKIYKSLMKELLNQEKQLDKTSPDVAGLEDSKPSLKKVIQRGIPGRKNRK